MSTRFELIKNGKRVCIAGIDGDGVLSAILSYGKPENGDGTHDFGISGLGMFDASQDRQHHVAWPRHELATGDEITIRILPPGEFDQPEGSVGSPQKSMHDPVFGNLNYYVDSWDAIIEFDSAPLQTAHVHICADENGPTECQRSIIITLRERHSQLWPSICSALVRCHPEITKPRKLAKLLLPQVGINLYGDTSEAELVYSVEGDAGERAYFVKLRDWEIAEVFMAE
ncbi:hypothetical protein Enr13x_75710 [Stieleria neptunia]|uniref:Uncharacterized protein n=1 Tax=Stieleria neptunia TaxID=2527979 RepID=A0A518I3H8_9BACT|nr:hypothetical protein [Stieleria neptunia]QDV47660.1 hypothetical protein Enr13x_75710 [Stieleria neptunia]